MDRYSDECLTNKTVKTDDGVVRWKANNAVPFDDDLLRMGLTPKELAACQSMRKADNELFFAEYRKARSQRSPEEVAQERAEARAEMGPGHVMVNLITGEKFTT